jgi:hypothetical protein
MPENRTDGQACRFGPSWGTRPRIRRAMLHGHSELAADGASTGTSATITDAGDHGEQLLIALTLLGTRVPACRLTVSEIDVDSAESLRPRLGRHC